ncbi:hypothetical protein BC834DRAFT_975254 [Gloeopeniophorella convolvens]|nr:hypothetical protein BC834DRAFT_975254 [Gloeopeniophorella convolvens]
MDAYLTITAEPPPTPTRMCNWSRMCSGKTANGVGTVHASQYCKVQTIKDLTWPSAMLAQRAAARQLAHPGYTPAAQLPLRA